MSENSPIHSVSLIFNRHRKSKIMKSTSLISWALLSCLIAASISVFGADAVRLQRPREAGNEAEISGMFKAWLSDGRIIYGAVSGVAVLSNTREVSSLELEAVSEPGFVNFQQESSFNFERRMNAELGMNALLSRNDRSIANIVMPEWGSISIINLHRQRGAQWTSGQMLVRIEGTATGFRISIEP